MSTKLIKVHQKDNVAIALVNLWEGDTILFEGAQIKILNDVKAKHKITLNTLKKGDPIFMYGVLVGKVMEDYDKDGALTVENVKHQAAKTTAKTEHFKWKAPDVSKWKTAPLWDITAKMVR